MKKILCSALFLILASCQTQQQIINPVVPVNQAAKISSKSFPKGTVKAEPGSLFPTEVGYTWNYNVVFHPTNDPYVDYDGTLSLEVDKSKKSNDETIINLRQIDSLNNEYNFPVMKVSKNNVSVSGVTYLGFGSLKADDLSIDFLHLPFKAGEKWDDSLFTGQTMKQEKVTIPSGTYDAWKVYVIGTYEQQYTAVGNYWIAPGIGIIKSELSVPGWTLESTLVSTTKKAKK